MSCGLATFTWLQRLLRTVRYNILPSISVYTRGCCMCLGRSRNKTQDHGPLDTRATCQNCRPVLMVDETLVCFGVSTLLDFNRPREPAIDTSYFLGCHIQDPMSPV